MKTRHGAPSCGQTSAYRTRVDHYLSLFFIPLIRVKQGEPFLLCEGCRRPVDGFQTSRHERPGRLQKDLCQHALCLACGKTVEFWVSFKYCPPLRAAGKMNHLREKKIDR